VADLGACCLVGFDLVEMRRFEQALARHPRLLERVFTVAEIAYCQSRARPVRHFAARFCAKEAVGKLLGVGITAWQEIEITSGQGDAGGLVVAASKTGERPQVALRGRALEEARRAGIEQVSVSLSHTDCFAGACAVALLAAAEPPANDASGSEIN